MGVFINRIYLRELHEKMVIEKKDNKTEKRSVYMGDPVIIIPDIVSILEQP